MAPADVVGVLAVGVLAVVDQQGGAARELVARDPVGLEVGQRRAEAGLVVGDVAERRVALGDPIAQRGAAMGHRRRADPRRPDVPFHVRSLHELDVAGQLANLDRRERRRDVARDPVAQRGLGRLGSPNREIGLRTEGRREEHQPLDVVHVEVGQQDVHGPRRARHGQAEIADPGAGVEHDGRPVLERHLHAGRVAPVPQRLRPGRGHRAARPPELDLHAAASAS